MKYALFLGCTIPVRSTNYEMSARKILSALGVEVVDVEGFSCCGFPMRSINAECADLLAANNLAAASKEGWGMVTLCSACTSVLTEMNKKLEEDEQERRRINEKLAKMGKRYEKPVMIRHFSRLIHELSGPENIKKLVNRDLSALKLAVHYGCHYTKPSEIYSGFDSHEVPHTIDEIIRATGAATVDYETKTDCCGGSVLGIDEGVALSMAGGKLRNLKECGVDALVLVCPFCSVMYDDNQKKIEGRFSEQYELPVLYLPQLLGLAMGLDSKELGIKMNKVSPQKVIEKITSSS